MALLSTLASAGIASLAACATPGKTTAPQAVDCHAHVFLRNLPMPDRRRAPSGYDAAPEGYLNVLDAHGITHGVLVQPSFLGTDNSYLVAALRSHPDRLRGIAVVEPSVTPAELLALEQAGVVGIRLNLVGLPDPNLSGDAWAPFLRALKRMNWQVEVHQLAAQLKPVLDPLLSAGLNVVVDHFGRPDPTLGIDDPGFQYLMSLGATRQVWIKLSGAYRNGPHGRGEEIAAAAMPLLRSAFGVHQLVWGSDWPHTLFEKVASYGEQRQLLDQWLPDPYERNVVLADTPTKLFAFAG